MNTELEIEKEEEKVSAWDGLEGESTRQKWINIEISSLFIAVEDN